MSWWLITCRKQWSTVSGPRINARQERVRVLTNSLYSALESVGHVETAEQFIEQVATKSSLSGRPYLMRCAGGEPVPTNQWLREVLERYRRCVSPSPPCASRLPDDAGGY